MVFLGFFLTVFTQSVFAQSTQKYYAPALNVQIPGLDFTKYPILRSGNVIQIPFLAAYVDAAYRYLITVTVVVATIAFIYGAFLYLMGSALPQIQSGKKIMSDAVIGMLIILAAHTILNIVNPDLLKVKGLTVTQIDPIQFSFEGMRTTLEATIAPENLNAPIPPAAPASATSIVPTAPGQCPLNLPPGSGLVEFYNQVIPKLTGATFVERVTQAGEIAVSCGVSLGSCGKTGGTLWTLAGVGDKSCLFGSKTICNPHEKNATRETVHAVPPATVRRLFGLRCGDKIQASCQKRGLPVNTDCIEGRGAAISSARSFIQAAAGGGYPDAWVNDLQPGDILWLYNANNECDGQHTVIFLGWASEGKARVVQGQWGSPVHFGTVCIKSSCGGNMQPLTMVFRPKASTISGN